MQRFTSVENNNFNNGEYDDLPDKMRFSKLKTSYIKMSKLNILYENIISGLLHVASIDCFKKSSEEIFQSKTIEILKNTDKLHDKCFNLLRYYTSNKKAENENVSVNVQVVDTKINTNNQNKNNNQNNPKGNGNKTTHNRQASCSISKNEVDNHPTLEKTSLNDEADDLEKLKKELDFYKNAVQQQNLEMNLLKDTKENIFNFMEKRINLMTSDYKIEFESLCTSINVMRDFYEDELIKKSEQIENLTLNIDNMLLK